MGKFFSFPFLLMLSLSLGLAPFFPEPHIVGKIRWLMGGAVGMGPIDWGDLLLHGTPWMLLVLKSSYTVGIKFKNKS
jgi:hypothetical protein